MKSNYKIIHDYNELNSFIDWLPDLDTNEKFYLSLFARKKYCPELIKTNDKTQLKRVLTNKRNMIQKIKQMEVEFGSYKINDLDAPQDSLVLYITPTPRCMKKATFDLMNRSLKLVQTQAEGYNLVAESYSCIQRAQGKTFVIDFDFDTELSEQEVNWYFLYKEVNKEAVSILRTRGGFHILIHPDRVDPKYKKTFYKNICNYSDIDQVGDQLLPVPGCAQGGFVPYFIKKAK